MKTYWNFPTHPVIHQEFKSGLFFTMLHNNKSYDFTIKIDTSGLKSSYRGIPPSETK